jgi:2',3'-cyclic-nucleotide 2'-phosphodiesterase/3'-nucleotidase
MVPGLRPEVTMRDIASTFIYPNSLCVLEIDGAVLRAALEKTAEYFALGEDGSIVINPSHFRPKIEHYNYDIFAGIEYCINVSRPKGARVREVRFRGEPVRDDQVFTIALNNYRAGGGGQYDMFRDAKMVKEITSTTADIVVEYLLTHPNPEIERPHYPIIETSACRN